MFGKRIPERVPTDPERARQILFITQRVKDEAVLKTVLEGTFEQAEPRMPAGIKRSELANPWAVLAKLREIAG